MSKRSLAVEPANDSHDLPDGWLCELTIEEGPAADVRDGVHGATSRRASDKGLLPISVEDYLQLLDASGRILRDDKAGSIPTQLAPILERLGIRPVF